MADGVSSHCIFHFTNKEIHFQQKKHKTIKPKPNVSRNMDYINAIRLYT